MCLNGGGKGNKNSKIDAENVCFRRCLLNVNYLFISVLRSLGRIYWGYHKWGNILAPLCSRQPICIYTSNISILARLSPNYFQRFGICLLKHLNVFYNCCHGNARMVMQQNQSLMLSILYLRDLADLFPRQA